MTWNVWGYVAGLCFKISPKTLGNACHSCATRTNLSVGVAQKGTTASLKMILSIALLLCATSVRGVPLPGSGLESESPILPSHLLSLDEIPPAQQYDAIFNRVFPLHSAAIPWESVNWTRYSKIVVTGPQRSGTTYFASTLAKHLGYAHHDEFAKSRW